MTTLNDSERRHAASMKLTDAQFSALKLAADVELNANEKRAADDTLLPRVFMLLAKREGL